MIYLHHFIGRSWILFQYRKPSFNIKEALAPNKANALHKLGRKMCPNIKGEREGEEGRDGKFNLLCPSYKKRKKIYILKEIEVSTVK